MAPSRGQGRWAAVCVVAAAVLVAALARAAMGVEPAPNRFWTIMDNVGALYTVMGRQLVDNVKSKYIELAGGDTDSVNVPEVIIQDGFWDKTMNEVYGTTAQDEPKMPEPKAPASETTTSETTDAEATSSDSPATALVASTGADDS